MHVLISAHRSPPGVTRFLSATSRRLGTDTNGTRLRLLYSHVTMAVAHEDLGASLGIAPILPLDERSREVAVFERLGEVGRAHQGFIDGISSVPSLGDGPDDEALAASHVAGREDLV